MKVDELIRRLKLCDRNSEVQVGYYGDAHYHTSWQEVVRVIEPTAKDIPVLLIIQSRSK